MMEAELYSSVSLLCGTNLVSFPPATITWTNPKGNILARGNGSLYTPISDETGVRLEISTVSFLDVGIWTCTIRTWEEDSSRPNGIFVVGERNITIHLGVPCEHNVQINCRIFFLLLSLQ